MKSQVATSGVAVTGAGRIKFYDTTLPPAPDPEHVVGGLYAVPFKTSARSYPGGEYLFPVEFEVAANDLGLSGAYGRPTFGALAKHMTESTPYEDTLRYAFVTQPFKPKCDWVLGSSETFEIVQAAMNGERIRELTDRRLLVARAVLGILDYDEVETSRRELAGIKESLEDICLGLQDEGFTTKIISCADREVLTDVGADGPKSYLVFSGQFLVGWRGCVEYKHYRTGQTFDSDNENPITIFTADPGVIIEITSEDLIDDKL